MGKQPARFTGLFLLMFIGLSEGFEWQSDEFLHVTGCLGTDVTLGWAYVTSPGETIETVFWSQGHDTIASLYQGNFLPKGTMVNRVTLNLRLNAAVTISSLQLSDTGYYGVQVTVATKDDQGNQLSETFTASALLIVVEPPALQSEVLDVQEITTDDTCALNRQMTLSCGTFSSRGFPPVEVMWTDPKGQVFPSTRFSSNHFDLDLPRRPLPGNYTCRVTCQSPVLRCLPPDSPLLSSHQVRVQTPREDGCGEADLAEEEEEEQVTMATADLARVRDLERNVTQLEHFMLDRLTEQAEQHRQQMADLTARLQTCDSRAAQQGCSDCCTGRDGLVHEGDHILAFRLTPGVGQPAYNSYTAVGYHHDEPLLRATMPRGCLSVNGSLPCDRHYRSKILELWQHLPVEQVRVVLYENGQEQAFFQFNGVGTTYLDWFSKNRLINSSYTDLSTEHNNYFSIAGHGALHRRFFINRNYGGCAKDKGWLVVQDERDACNVHGVWGADPPYPAVAYINTSTCQLWTSEHVRYADVLAVWVKLSSP